MREGEVLTPPSGRPGPASATYAGKDVRSFGTAAAELGRAKRGLKQSSPSAVPTLLTARKGG